VEFVVDADGSNDGTSETLEGETEIILDGLVEYFIVGMKEVVNDGLLDSEIAGDTCCDGCLLFCVGEIVVAGIHSLHLHIAKFGLKTINSFESGQNPLLVPSRNSYQFISFGGIPW